MARINGMVGLVGILASLSPGQISGRDTISTLVLKGRVLGSFQEPHRLIQVRDAIYCIRKSLLTRSQDRALGQSGHRIELNVMPAAIDFAWRDESLNGLPFRFGAGDGVRQATVGGVVLAGFGLPSFDEPHFLIQVGRFVFRIRKSFLNPEARSLVIPGRQIELEVPSDAVSLAWKPDRHEGTRTLSATPGHPGSDANMRWIQGKVLPSLSDSQVLVQSGDTIYQIARAPLAGRAAGIGSQVGRRVEISVPREAIELAWKAGAPGSSRTKLLDPTEIK